MAPARKKSKPNIEKPKNQHNNAAAAGSDSHAPAGSETRTQPTSIDTSSRTSKDSQSRSQNETPKTPSAPGTSWYTGGSWRSKASPVAQIARESISVAQGTTSEASEVAAKRPSPSVSKSMRGSRKSVPLIAEPTKIHAISDATDKSRPRFSAGEKASRLDGGIAEQEESKAVVVEAAPLPPEPVLDNKDDATSVKSTDTATRPQSGAWFGWWSRPDGYGSDGEKIKEATNQPGPEEEASNTPLPGTPAHESTDEPWAHATDITSTNKPSAGMTSAAQWEGLNPEMSAQNASSRSWFGLWSTAQNEQAAAEAQAQAQVRDGAPSKGPEPEITISAEPPTVNRSGTGKEAQKPELKAKPDEDRPKSSGWAFWSTERPADATATPGGTQHEVGELAVADTPSQSHPEAAQFNEQKDQQGKPSQTDLKRASSLLNPNRGKRGREKASPAESSAPSTSTSQAPSPAISQQPTPAITPPRDDSQAPTPVKRGKQAQTRPNLILPSFEETYEAAPSQTYMERFTTYLAQTLRLPGTSSPPPPQHVFISPTGPKVKKAIALGIHGFFPAPLIQKVLGQPTGTSIRFSNYAAAAIKAWCQDHQPDITDVEIEKVALEGEGFIADRVATLWKLMLNWLSQLRQADFILLACHSQGVPVTFMLLAKLIQLGCLNPNVRIGVCAMAGINLGPFLEYKSRFFGGAALELFDFCHSNSKVSKTYADAVNVCLRHGVRVTFVGSLDDQLVSLESSLHAPLSHPYVSRAVFIDGRLHTPNFLTHLVVFALKLRNLGISDHGLIRELSAPLAGSLMGGEGHSRVYDDPAVYRLAVSFALESTNMPPQTQITPPPTATTSLLAHDQDKATAKAAARRASLSGYPTTMAQANSIRRGSITALNNLPGIAPIIAAYDPPPSGATANPFYLPWAVRGMLEEDVVKREPKMQEEVALLVKEFEEWRPTSKVLKDVRWRLEGVKSML